MEKELIPYLIAIGVGFATQILTAMKGRRRTNNGVDSLSKMVKTRFEEIHEKLKAQEEKLGLVKDELTDNGGGSTKDGVRLIREDLKGVKADIRDLAETQTAHHTIQMNESQEAIFKFNARGDCIFANEKMCDILGLAYKDILGRGFLQAIGRTQADRTAFLDDWIDAVEQDIPFARECDIKNATTGKLKPCEIKSTAFRQKNDPKNVLFFYGKVRELG